MIEIFCGGGGVTTETIKVFHVVFYTTKPFLFE